MANPQYSLSVTEGTELQLSLLGPQGPQGPAGANGAAGPNEVTTSTATTITGLLKGNGSTVLAATAGSDYQAPLVSGTNIKTVNGGSLLGSGDIDTDPVAQTWSGDNPNIPETLVVSSITGNDSIDQLPLSRRADENGRPAWGDVTFTYVRWDTGLWEAFASTEPADEFIGSEASTALTPVGLVFDSPSTGSGSITFTGDNPTGDYLGQLLQASDDSWWRWNGTSWERDLTYADASATFSSGKAILWGSSADATLSNLGGGTAGKAIFGAVDYSGTGSVRKLMGLDTTDSPTFGGAVTVGANSSLIHSVGARGNMTGLTGNTATPVVAASNVDFCLVSGHKIAWSSVSNNVQSIRDLQIWRQSSGVLNVGTDGTTINGTIQLANLTASGTVSANTLSVTDTSTTLTNLGGGTAGKAIFGAADYSGTGSVRKLMGLDTTDNVSFNEITLGNAVLQTPSNKALFLKSGYQSYIQPRNSALICFDVQSPPMANFRSSAAIGWASRIDPQPNNMDLSMFRDAADTLAQRRGTNAQTTRIYDTYASATDYHRVAIATARTTLTNVSGASVTAIALIPAGAVVMGVTSKVTTALGTGNGTTGYQIGTAADADRWADKTATAAGTTTDNRDWTAGTIECFLAATDVIVTAKGGNFDGTGVIYLSVQYMTGQAD